MDSSWESQFRERMRSFDEGAPAGSASVSIKIRVTSGCFHREHSPRAYEHIDEELGLIDRSGFDFVEHESGPEILVALAVAGSVAQLASSMIDLVTTVIRARRDGVSKGDAPSEPIELITRTFDHSGTLREETLLRIGSQDQVDRREIATRLAASIERALSSDSDATD